MPLLLPDEDGARAGADGRAGVTTTVDCLGAAQKIRGGSGGGGSRS